MDGGPKKRTPGRPGSPSVEMAGVEPASEEKTIQTTTCVFCLSVLALPDPTDRICRAPPRMAPLSRGSPVTSRESARLARQKSAPLWNPAGGIPQDGPLNYLSSQCVVVVCTYCFSALLTCNSESTARNLNHPHPRRNHVIPSQSIYIPSRQKSNRSPVESGALDNCRSVYGSIGSDPFEFPFRT
jgi:hypothetical protein